MTTSPNRKFLEAATVIGRIDDVDRLRRRLENDPSDHLASTQLEGVLRDRRDWSGLIEVLVDRAAYLDDAEASRVLADVADLYVERLGERDAAMVVLQTAFAASPTDTGLADRLTELAKATNAWDEVIDLFVVEVAKLDKAGPAVSEIWLRIAWAHLAGRGDVDAALAALERVTDMGSSAAIAVVDQIEATATTLPLLRLLLEVCRRLGDRARHLRTLHRILSMTADPATLAEVNHEIARHLLDEGDLSSAEWHLAEVLRFSPGHVEAAAALSALYKERGEFRKAATLLETSKQCVEAVIDRVELAVEAAHIYSGSLEEHTAAHNLYESALAADPEHVGAAIPLAERYYREQSWHQLEPVIEVLIRRIRSLPPGAPSRAELYRRAAETAFGLGKHRRAVRAYDSALSESGGHGQSADCYEGRARASLCLRDWAAAADDFRSAYDMYVESEDATAAARALREIGHCAKELGDTAAAREYFEYSLQLDSDHQDVIAELGAICAEVGEYERAVEFMRRELAMADVPRRVRLLANLGRITSRHLGDPGRAITIFQHALELEPADREVLHQLIEHYSAAGWWEEAVWAILRIAEVETQPVRKGKYLQAAAAIARSELRDYSRAADLYDSCLDCYYGEGVELPDELGPHCMRGFEELGEMLSAAQMWKRLEQSYRRMIKRISPRDPIAADLWHGLGEVYRLHLGHRDSAIGSFEIASALDDRRITRHRILVDLYESAGPEKAREAIARRHRLLEAEPFEAAHYKALRKLYARTRQYDRAWMACRALAFLGHADSEEQMFFEARLAHGYELPNIPMTREFWASLRHSDEDRDVTAVLTLVAEEAASVTAVAQKDLGLDPRVPGTEQFANLVGAIATAMGVDGPDVFMHPQSRGDVLWANACNGRALARTVAIGRDLYQGRHPRYLVAALSKALVYSRPGYLLRMAATSTDQLESIFLAAICLERSDVPVPEPLVESVGRYRVHFARNLSRSQRHALAQVVARFVGGNRGYNLSTWTRSVDALSRRVSLLYSGDLAAATDVAGGGRGDEGVGELLRHSVSDEHSAARIHLGLARD